MGGRHEGNQASTTARTAAHSFAQVAELLGTTERFPRRLISVRRVRFVRLGRHVRVPESALAEFIASGVVAPIYRSHTRVA